MGWQRTMGMITVVVVVEGGRQRQHHASITDFKLRITITCRVKEKGHNRGMESNLALPGPSRITWDYKWDVTSDVSFLRSAQISEFDVEKERETRNKNAIPPRSKTSYFHVYPLKHIVDESTVSGDLYEPELEGHKLPFILKFLIVNEGPNMQEKGIPAIICRHWTSGGGLTGYKYWNIQSTPKAEAVNGSTTIGCGNEWDERRRL
ncbi:hypothetical protein B0H16DRAFT_1766914 [Mycena metata]|uniref:Uncharacterized protein n=1 Tax=Mycena metata TaxID=1033252 RepID=A0AAD7I4G6_9AGAR|nr:hypothetical protein B0H16DRAFT_1766914 [Mycena metata]